MSTKERILEKLSKRNPTLDEPTKPSFEGFDGSSSLGNRIEKSEEYVFSSVSHPDPEPIPAGTDEPGTPVFFHEGHPLAWENDPAHIKLYAWCLINLLPQWPLMVDADAVGSSLGLTSRQVRDALVKLVEDGDLERFTERGSVKYSIRHRW